MWKIQERRVGWDVWFDTGDESDNKSELEELADRFRKGVEGIWEFQVVEKEA